MKLLYVDDLVILPESMDTFKTEKWKEYLEAKGLSVKTKIIFCEKNLHSI